MSKFQSITEDHLDLMHYIHKDGEASQRKISKETGFSLGKVNYCIKGLIDIGFVKMKNFSKSSQKMNYVYILTPRGIQEKQLSLRNLLSKRNKNTINLIHILIDSFLCKKINTTSIQMILMVK